jgi:hypothetical protein
MDYRIALTDDEVLALASRGGGRWPTVLPTIDLTDEAATQAAANRGARSLVARELMEPEGNGVLQKPLDLLVAPVLGGKPTFGTYVADGDYRYAPTQASTACYDSGGGACVSELVSGAGIHYLSTSTTETCLGIVRQLTSSVFESGLPEAAGGSDVAYAIVGPVANGSMRMAAVGRGSIRALRLRVDEERFEDVGQISEPSRALDFVLRADTRGITPSP